MDINQWLEDAAAATRPKQPQPIMHPSEPLMVPTTARNPVRNHSRNGLRRSGADTSILAPEDTPPEVPHVKVIKAAKPEVQREMTLPLTGKSPNSKLPCVVTRTTNDEPYRRKKRRKTRADRYEVKPEQSRHTHAIRKCTDGSKKASLTGQRKKRKATEKVTTSVVHNFNAPNVKRDRLTLQPTPNLGLFNKGRASSPFKGRGPPDLAFSELNFLQKRKGLHDAGIPAQNGKTRRPTERARQNKDEISAYFAPTRPPLVEKDVNLVLRSHRDSSSRKTRARSTILQSDVSERSLARPRIQPIEGQVAAARSERLNSTSATYFSWSASVIQEADFKVRSKRPEVSVQRLESELQYARKNHHNVASPSNKTSPTKLSPQASHVRHQVNNEGPFYHGNESDGVHCMAASEHAMKEDARWYKRRNSNRIGGASSTNLPLESATAHTESLSLPSSPPNLRELCVRAQSVHESTRETSGHLKPVAVVVPSRDSHRSSSPVGRLLKNCNALFVAQPYAGALLGMDEEYFEDNMLEGDSVATLTMYRNGRSNEDLLNEDLRRSWRLTGELLQSTVVNKRPEIKQDLVLGNYESLSQAEDEEEGEDRYSDQGEVMMHGYRCNDEQEGDNYAFGDENTDVSLTHEHVGERESQSLSEDFSGFWRPNILY